MRAGGSCGSPAIDASRLISVSHPIHPDPPSGWGRPALRGPVLSMLLARSHGLPLIILETYSTVLYSLLLSFPLVLTAHRGAHVSVVNSDIRFRFASAALRASHRISSHRISSRRRGLCHCVTVSIRRPKQLTALLPFECRENENEFAEKTKESASSEHFVPVLKSVAAAVALWRFLFEEIR